MPPSKRKKSRSIEAEDEEPNVLDEESEGYTCVGSRLLALQICAAERSPGNVQIGAALMDNETGMLSTLGRTIGWEGEFGFLASMILNLTKPVQTILVASKLDERYIDILKSLIQEEEEETENADDVREKKQPKIKVKLLPNSFFDFQNACKLVGIKFGMVGSLGSIVDLSNKASLQCAGAVIAHSQQLFPESFSSIQYEMFDLGSFLVMDLVSTKILDIARLEEHPSVIRGQGRAKEGFTLLSLLDRSKSPLGLRTLRRWISRPLTNIEDIQQRLDTVRFLTQKIGQEAIVKVSRYLSQVGDLPRSLLRLKTCSAKAKDWQLIKTSLTNIHLALNELLGLKADGNDLPALLQDILQSSQTNGLFEVSRALDTIDWELVRHEDRLAPLNGINNQVDECRKQLISLPDLLQAETENLNVPGMTIRCIPVIGFVAAMTDDCSFDVSTNCQFLFDARKKIVNSEGTQEDDQQEEEGERIRYFKTERTIYLDSEIGDIPGHLKDIEDEFTRGIESLLLNYEKELLLVAHRSAELDTLLCFAEVSHDFNYVEPEFVQDSIFMVQQARHPLLERVLDERFVPNDIILDRKCLVLTGPNFSGKSVILKTIALISIMGQIGCFVPAEKARFGVVDRIFTRMSSMESVGSAAIQKESSFTIDVQQMVQMLHCCTPQSLLLCDEFGKGTNSIDGTALLSAIIRHLAMGKSGPTPRSIFATHLVEMFDCNILKVGEDVVLGEMAVEFEGNEPIPLFRLSFNPSIKRDSYGIACAKRAGVNQDVIERASEFSNRLLKNQPLWNSDDRRNQEKRQGVEEFVNQYLNRTQDYDSKELEVFFNTLIGLT